MVKTLPRIDPDVAGRSCGKQRTGRSTRVDKTISEIVRTAVLLSRKELQSGGQTIVRRCKFSRAVEATRVLKHYREEFTTLVLNWEASRACQMSKSWQIIWQHY